MLEKYYVDPHRWGFTFQVYAAYTRVQALQKAFEENPNSIKIAERSVLADKYVFSQIMKELGFMEEAEFEVFRSLYESF